LESSDFWVCGHIKTLIAGCIFKDFDELLEAAIEFLCEKQLSELQLVFATGLNEWNGSEPTMETTITSK
jgi:hypothetical protein